MYEALLSLYSTSNKDVPSLGPVPFELVNFNSGDFGTERAPETGEVRIKKAGVYLVSWDFSGLSNSPCPTPGSVLALSIAVNKVIQFGSASASSASSPPDVCIHTSGNAIIELEAGDTVSLVSLCERPIHGMTSPYGVLGTIPFARLNLTLLRSAP